MLTNLFQKMINDYNSMSFTHNYIFGFCYKHIVYMATVDSATLPYICKLDVASRGAGYALRYCPTVQQKLFLMTKAVPLCSEMLFDSLCQEKYKNAHGKMVKYNCGEVFEKLVTEHFGQKWVKDNVPFTDGPDVIGNGVPYQVKYEKATFTNEKTLMNLTTK